jgi:hypothetical protein
MTIIPRRAPASRRRRVFSTQPVNPPLGPRRGERAGIPDGRVQMIEQVSERLAV